MAPCQNGLHTKLANGYQDNGEYSTFAERVRVHKNKEWFRPACRLCNADKNVPTAVVVLQRV